MTPQELKNSILQLAIQGKLVEQRSEEGTAEELYEQIQAEKQKLIKTGTIKKEKPLPEIIEDEKPFDIPESWKWHRIGSICNILNGFTPLRSNPEFWNGDVSWFTIDDMREQGRFIKYTRQHISKIALSKNTERIVPADSVLLCCTASVGEYAYTNISLTTNQQFNALVVKNEYKYSIDPMFIFEFVQTLKTSLIAKAGKTTFNFLSVGKLAEMLIPLPPLAEQKRIVAKIEELLPYIDRYEQAWTKLEDFNKRFPSNMQKSILQMAIQGKLVEQNPADGTGEELYQQIQAEKQKLIKAGTIKKEKTLPEITEDEKPFDIPESWKWVRLNEITTKITDGTHHSPPNGEIGDFMYVTAKNIKNSGVKLTGITYVPAMTHKEIYARCNPSPGDLLLIKDGATTGVITVNNIAEPFSMLSSVALLKLSESMNAWYLVYTLRSDLFYKILRAQMKGTGITRITLKQIEPMVIPLPPLAEQKRIVAKLEEILPICEKLKR